MWKERLWDAASPILRNADVIVSVILLISLFIHFFPVSLLSSFIHEDPLSVFTAAVVGGLLTGNPTNGYIIGGELLRHGVPLLPVLAFLAAWVTVGFLQIPVESRFLGLKFSIVRNVVSLLFSILVAFLLGVIL